jgi:large subunit ribosomal protein L25
MITLKAKERKELGKKVKDLRGQGIIPAVLYGAKTKPQNLELDLREFEKVFHEAGESSLIDLEVGTKKFSVLVHEMQVEPISLKPIHVDFFQPDLTEEILAKVPLVFVGEAPAAKDLGGTFVRNISELEIKALPQKLPHEIKVDISSLLTFENTITVKDLKLSEGVKAHKGLDDIVAFVAAPEKVEEELQKPIEAGVAEVEKVEKPKKEEAAPEAADAKTEAKK